MSVVAGQVGRVRTSGERMDSGPGGVSLRRVAGGTTTVPTALVTSTGSGSTSAALADRSGRPRQTTWAVSSTFRDRVPTATSRAVASTTSPAMSGAWNRTSSY